ncbi:uncharacterized protein Z520_07112 [Fonsecaea multimorphosa CBS 102226]|uniref:Uncharacterized protein n=1 Tax=Fonsecaea multimorphosa CBS 102226 TaxID=1442371 RepID=A0A0D2KK67_9EURO|nr:uncharacterized protein Z520_07112 [Fonsecaea multimorphosa CBS 102226]KIX96998.1 hypothetical protein Z520_07112 [Fonsecaea multimorphosa CBS 102226]OAL22779.1 hypothetical protein AYO22_06687 [Fonsecaea multimorphosa]
MAEIMEGSTDIARNQQDGRPEAATPAPTLRFAPNTNEPAEDDLLAEEAPSSRDVKAPSPDYASSRLSPQVSKSSKSIRLEPPPVVMRPPKVKFDGFGSAALSWFAWTRNEEKDLPDCARSMRRSYTYRSTFRLFGFSLSKDISYKTSESGLDVAMQNVRLGWGKSETNWMRDKLPKARQRFGLSKSGQTETPDEEAQDAASQDASSTTAAVEGQKAPKEPKHTIPRIAHPWHVDYYYVVVGIMGDEIAPKETLRRVMQIDGLFQQIRKAHRYLRNPIRRALSLKEVSGFSIYQCDPSKGYHREVELDGETESALAELWRSYNTHKLDYEGRWMLWIHQHFNNSSKNPEAGTLALELRLRWSVFKVVFWGVVPILLSLAVGFSYMYTDHGDVDDVAVAEAAWVIATYIITTSALIFALLAVITQLGDI